MIDVRAFDGSPAELASFVTAHWRRDYEGRMAMPLWSGEYFDWQLGLTREPERTQVLAASIDGRLAGVILGCRHDFRTPQGRVGGLISSWLTVAPEFRRQGLVGALKGEQARRLREEAGGLILAYRYIGSRHSLSKPPTGAEQASGEWSVRKAGFWVRVLDVSRAAEWYVEGTRRVLTRLGGPFIRSPRAPSAADIRPYRESDLDRCLALVQESNGDKGFAIDWIRDRLGVHCAGGGVGSCLVLEREGGPQGFVTFHVLPFAGRTVEPVGVIDLVVLHRLRGRERRALVQAALGEMQTRGAILALKLRLGDSPAGMMLAAGFIPWVRDSWEAVRRIDGGPPLPLHRPQSVLWR